MYVYLLYWWVSDFLLIPQTPSSGMIADTGNENPNLLDNWDDAEGYYRKLMLINALNIYACIACIACFGLCVQNQIRILVTFNHLYVTWRLNRDCDQGVLEVCFCLYTNTFVS